MSYQEAKEVYAKIGVDTEQAIEKLGGTAISVHCWQGDDVVGLDGGGRAVFKRRAIIPDVQEILKNSRKI